MKTKVDKLVDLIERADLKMKTIKLMTDIDANIPQAVSDWTELCARDRRTALGLMIDGEIIRKTERMLGGKTDGGSADLDYLMPDHRAVVIFRSTGHD